MFERAKQGVLAGLLVAAMLPVLGAEQVYDFDVNLDKRPIGTHRFTVRKSGDTLSIVSDARFEVRVLGVSVYRYRHQATEQWQADCLTSIEATTTDNGRELRVAGMQRQNHFQLAAPAPAKLPACVSAYAYWDRDLMLRHPQLLNPQTGKLDTARLELLGRETLTVRGQSVPVDRYRLRAAQNVIDLWYSPQGDWLQLESTTGSRRLIYRLRDS